MRNKFFSGGESSVQISLRFRNTNLHGFSKGEVTRVTGFQANPDKNRIEIKFKVPFAVLEGPYQMKGKVLVLPVRGKGDMNLQLSEIEGSLRFLTKKVERDGKVYMEIEKSKFVYDVNFAKLNFENLFDGDKALGDNINLFLNENWRIVFDELKDPIQDQFNVVFREVFNDFFRANPYNELFEK